MAEAISHTQGIKRLCRMVTLQSIRRNLATEDEEFRRETDAYQKEMHDVDTQRSSPEGEPMEVWAGGNVTVYQGNEDASPKKESPIQRDSAPKSNGWKKTAIAAALLAAGVGAGSLPWLLSRPSQSSPSMDTDTVNEYSVGFGEPETVDQPE